MVKTIASGSKNVSGAPRVFRLVGGKLRKESPRPAEPEPAAVPSPEQIRERAYEAWCQAGRPVGDGVHFWLEAERALRSAFR